MKREQERKYAAFVPDVAEHAEDFVYLPNTDRHGVIRPELAEALEMRETCALTPEEHDRLLRCIRRSYTPPRAGAVCGILLGCLLPAAVPAVCAWYAGIGWLAGAVLLLFSFAAAFFVSLYLDRKRHESGFLQAFSQGSYTVRVLTVTRRMWRERDGSAGNEYVLDCEGILLTVGEADYAIAAAGTPVRFLMVQYGRLEYLKTEILKRENRG